MLHTKRLVIVLGFLLVGGCSTQSSLTSYRNEYNSFQLELLKMLKEARHDAKIALVTLEGFRIQMTPSIAQKVAEERGYNIDTQDSNITFYDLISSSSNNKEETIELVTNDPLQRKRITLTFEDNRVTSVDFTITKYGIDKDVALTLLNPVLKRHPYLELHKREENFIVYFYKPTKFSFLSASVLWKGYVNIKTHVHDNTYQEEKRIKKALNELQVRYGNFTY